MRSVLRHDVGTAKRILYPVVNLLGCSLVGQVLTGLVTLDHIEAYNRVQDMFHVPSDAESRDNCYGGGLCEYWVAELVKLLGLVKQDNYMS